MITVEVFRNKPGKIIGYKAVGHADNPIVCNSISIILQVGIYGVSDYLNRSVEYTLDSVNGITYMKLKESPTAKTEAVLGAVIANVVIFARDFKEVELIDKRGV